MHSITQCFATKDSEIFATMRLVQHTLLSRSFQGIKDKYIQPDDLSVLKDFEKVLLLNPRKSR